MRFEGNGPDYPYQAEQLLWDEKPVVNWFLQELSTTYLQWVDGSFMTLNIKPSKDVKMKINGDHFGVNEITTVARRVVKNKTCFMRLTGDAFYDWDTQVISVPAKGEVSIHGVDPNMVGWEDYDGDIPAIGKYQSIIHRYMACIDLMTAVVPDLTKLD